MVFSGKAGGVNSKKKRIREKKIKKGGKGMRNVVLKDLPRILMEDASFQRTV